MAHYAENGSRLTFGQRVRRERERKGQTRPVLAGLVGRSTEWVKAIETDRLGMPRLPLLLRLAEALGVDDLAALTGDERLAAATYTKAVHPSLLRVKESLTTYDLLTRDEEPAPATALAIRVQPRRGQRPEAAPRGSTREGSRGAAAYSDSLGRAALPAAGLTSPPPPVKAHRVNRSSQAPKHRSASVPQQSANRQ